MRDLRGLGRRVRAAALVVGTVLLTGCAADGDGASTTLPSTTTAASETRDQLPALGPPDLPMPEEARAQTPDGAKAFAAYYIEVYDAALHTLDATHLRDLSKGCDTCDALAEQVEAVADQGAAYEGGEVRVDAITAPVVTGTEAQFAFDITQAPLTVTIDGEPIEGRTYPERPSPNSGGILTWDDERSTWLMAQLDVQ